MSIPVPEEVPKRLTPSLPDVGSGWTVTCPISPHTFKMSAWSNFTPLCDREVLLWHRHIPQCQYHTQGGFNGQHSPHARSSHSGEGMARALLDHYKALEDDFQTQHVPVRRITRPPILSRGKAGMFRRKPKAADWVLHRHRQGGGNAGNS